MTAIPHAARALVALLLLTGCTVNDHTITQDQATARVEQLIKDTAAALRPEPRLELIPHGTGPEECTHDSEPPGKVTINRAYWLREIPKSENMNISRQVRAYWQAQGHRIVASGKPDNPDLSGESQPDGFILALTWAEGDDLFLAATSTCVWPDGTAPPDGR
ncbi:hypothetical protein [Nonomuraea sediminis]|uniref:hypothetical protein n=1 Tax=Nonomuraea sediminis TaxID=2835864 RepID=UPI001BDD1BF5|nr:hypothetical protein [Nonomuraea sediminis]